MKKILFIFLFIPISLAIAQTKTDWDPKITEVWEPVPKPLEIKECGAPPSDAIVLLGKKNYDSWIMVNSGSELQWEKKGGVITVKPKAGDIETKENFGDIQLHIEWRSPKVVKGSGQGRGNNGVFLQGRYELQVLDRYNNKTYSNGQAGAIYKQHIPLVNAMKAPGEWQTYDIVFHAPVFNSDGNKVKSGTLTVFHNGVLIHDNVTIRGTSEYIGMSKNIPHGEAPIKLQDNGGPRKLPEYLGKKVVIFSLI